MRFLPLSAPVWSSSLERRRHCHRRRQLPRHVWLPELSDDARQHRHGAHHEGLPLVDGSGGEDVLRRRRAHIRHQRRRWGLCPLLEPCPVPPATQGALRLDRHRGVHRGAHWCAEPVTPRRLLVLRRHGGTGGISGGRSRQPKEHAVRRSVTVKLVPTRRSPGGRTTVHSLEPYSGEDEMSAARGPRGPYARRSVTYVVWVLSIVLVVALAVGGYEINHQRSEINSLHSRARSRVRLLPLQSSTSMPSHS